MTTAVAEPRQQNTQLAPVGSRNTLKGLLDSMRQSIADVIPKHLTPERVMKMALVAASRQPKLFECTRESFLQSVMRASELGLDCSGTLGSGYLVPFFNSTINASECQFIPGYRGLIDLARRSGQIASIEARCVYDNDAFDVQYGTETRIVHKPELGPHPGEIRCVYAVAKIVGQDEKQIEVMTRAQIDGIRRMSKAGKFGPWADHYDEMARKTVVRRLCKYLPLSPELERAFAIEEEIERRTDYAASVVSDLQPGRGVAALEQKLADRQPEPPVPADDPFGEPSSTPQQAAGTPETPAEKPKPRKTAKKAAEPQTPDTGDVGTLRLKVKTEAGKLGYESAALKAIFAQHGIEIDNGVPKMPELAENQLRAILDQLEEAISAEAN